MLLAVISALLCTTPPLVPAPSQPDRTPLTWDRSSYFAPPVTGKPVKPPPDPLAPATLGLFFAPLSLFSLSVWVEADLALIGGLDVFANLGGGPLGQFGFDAGLRYYVMGSSLDGFYFDARASGFALPGSKLWMLGPGLQIGHGWRVKRFTLSIALGVTTWFGLSRATTGNTFIFGPTTDADVIAFPGVSQPQTEKAGVQPTVRVSLGPWF